MEILESFERWVRDAGTREAVVSRGENLCLDFAGLSERADRWCRLLDRHLGSRCDGLAVAVATGNGVAFVELVLALWRRGTPVVAMDGALSEGEKLGLCQRLGIPHLLHRGGSGSGLVDGVRHLDLRGPELEPAAIAEGVRLIKLTSGSTGDPVGLLFDLESLAVGIHQIGKGMGLESSDRVLMALPLSHSYGFDNGVLSLFALGTPLILEPAKFPGPLLRALAESRATFLPLVPPLVRSLGRVSWPEGLALRTVICAGGRLDPEVAMAFRRASGRPVQDFYGSTETGGISFETEPESPAACGTVGRPLPGVQIDLDDGGRVVVTSRANRLGELGHPPRTDRRVVAGDLAEWTPEGRLRLVGRSADFLDIGGRKVPAATIERALLALPGVGDAAVVGVADAVRGERVVAFLVSDHWPVSTSGLDRSLAPREMRRLEALPYSERGKLDRTELRRRALEGAGRRPAESSEDARTVAKSR